MKDPKDARLTCAIDAQISPDVAGGTETALLSLIGTLGRLETQERFLLLGLKHHGEKLAPFMGPNQMLKIWPWTYVWYVPGRVNPVSMSPRWRKLRAAFGPFGDVVSFVHRFYAQGRPLGARARKLQARLGPLGKLVPPAYRFYRGLDQRAPKLLSRARVDAELRPDDVSVVHFPYPLHFPTRLPFVYEPWGLPHLHYPEFFQSGEAAWMEGVFREGCEEAALVVTATRWVKEDIVAKYRIPPGKIAVIPRVPPEPPAAANAPGGAPRGDLPRDFALFPAMTWPSKNHIGLLHALAALRDAHGVTLHVVCTGRIYQQHWTNIQAEMNALGLGSQVHFLGPVPGDELHRLYRLAKFLVFPSLFEGFGFPVLEAFQHRLPVVVSNATCLPEVAGDAGLIFDVKKEEALVEALLSAVRNPGLLEELRARGEARLRGYSREKMARMFITCYRRAAGAPLSEEQRALLSEMIGQ